MKADVDTHNIMEAVKFVFRNTEKELPDILNRAALYTIIGGKGVDGAMQLTPKAAREKIEAVPAQIIARVVMAKAREKNERLTKREIVSRVRREYRRRIAASGYTAYVGWNKAAIAFGGRGIGSRANQVAYAQMGYGRRATLGNYVAEMVNTAPAAGLIGMQALQDALDNQAADMVNHVEEKMQQICNQVSAR